MLSIVSLVFIIQHLLINRERGLQWMVAVDKENFVYAMNSTVQVQMAKEEYQVFWCSFAFLIKSTNSV